MYSESELVHVWHLRPGSLVLSGKKFGVSGLVYGRENILRYLVEDQHCQKSKGFLWLMESAFCILRLKLVQTLGNAQRPSSIPRHHGLLLTATDPVVLLVRRLERVDLSLVWNMCSIAIVRDGSRRDACGQIRAEKVLCLDLMLFLV